MDFAIVAKHGITFGNPKRNSTILIPVGQFKTRSLVFYPQGMRREKYQAVHLLRWPDRQFGADRPGFSASKDSAFVIPAGQLHLFLDNREITKLENLKRTMHKPDLKIYKTWCTVPHNALLTTAAEIKGRDHQVVP